jgi:hypothetical protein
MKLSGLDTYVMEMLTPNMHLKNDQNNSCFYYVNFCPKVRTISGSCYIHINPWQWLFQYCLRIPWKSAKPD